MVIEALLTKAMKKPRITWIQGILPYQYFYFDSDSKMDYGVWGGSGTMTSPTVRARLPSPGSLCTIFI